MAKEFADVIVYLDILAMRAGVNLGNATVKKFNEVSKRVGCEIFLSEQPNNLVDYYLNKDEEPIKKEESIQITKEQAELCLIEEVLNVINVCKVSKIIVSNEVAEILKKAKEFVTASQGEIGYHKSTYTDLIGSLNNCAIETPTHDATMSMHYSIPMPTYSIYGYGFKGCWILLHELSI